MHFQKNIYMYAPIALFVYNRLEQTKQVVTQLLTNTLSYETDLYVFSDGGKDEQSWAEVKAVREYLHDLEKQSNASSTMFKSVTITERPENWYVERNIMDGINEVFKKHDTIIVLEDDIFVSEFFLDYMNTAFDLYREDRKVMHVSGFTNLDLINEHPLLVYDNPYVDLINETYFTPHMSGWGWGTWRDRWQEHFHHFETEAEALAGLTPAMQDKMQYGGNFPCLKLLKNNPIPWDVCWGIAIYKADGLCLTPGYTLVRNIGLKEGTHFSTHEKFQYYNYDRPPLERLVKVSRRDILPKPEIEELFAEAIKDWGIVYTPLGKFARMALKGGTGALASVKQMGGHMSNFGAVLSKVGAKLGQWASVYGGKFGRGFVKFCGKAAVVLKKLAKILWKLLKRLFVEIRKNTPYVVGFFQGLFRWLSAQIKNLINKLLTKM